MIEKLAWLFQWAFPPFGRERVYGPRCLGANLRNALIRVVIVRQYLRSAVCAVVPPSGREHATWVEFVCVSDSLVHLQCAHLFPLPSWLDAAAVENKDKALDANGEDIMALYDGLQMRLGKPKLAILCPRVIYTLAAKY